MISLIKILYAFFREKNTKKMVFLKGPWKNSWQNFWQNSLKNFWKNPWKNPLKHPWKNPLKHPWKNLKNYGHLLRLFKPLGFCWLLAPGWWGFFLGLKFTKTWNNFLDLTSLNPSSFPWGIFFLLSLGLCWARSLGCAYNDYKDQDIDGEVPRTKNRFFPSLSTSSSITSLSKLPSSSITSLSSITLFSQEERFFYIFLSSFFLFPLSIFLPLLFHYFPPKKVFFLCFLALVFLGGTLVYPLLKRPPLKWLPQLFLGLLFPSSLFLGFFMASGDFFNHYGCCALFLLYVYGILWIVEGDTHYAYSDAPYDKALGLVSLSILTSSWGPASCNLRDTPKESIFIAPHHFSPCYSLWCFLRYCRLGCLVGCWFVIGLLPLLWKKFQFSPPYFLKFFFCFFSLSLSVFFFSFCRYGSKNPWFFSLETLGLLILLFPWNYIFH